MQRKSKGDTDRFMRAIAAFSAAPEEVTRRGRRLQNGESGSAHAILAEIDETVLRRKLVFCNEQDATLTLDVGERRLLTVLSAPEPLDGVYPDLIGRPLEEADAPTVMNLLTEFASQEPRVFVVSRPSDAGETGVFRGLSAKMLVDLQRMPLPDELPATLRRAVEVAKADCDALVICQSGKSLYRHGEKKLVDMLDAHLSSLPSGRGNMRDVTLWCVDPPAGGAVMLAEVDDFRVAVIGSFAALQGHFNVWREAVTLK